MDRLAKQQACQLWIEQEVEKGIAAGEKKADMGKRIAGEILKHFEAMVTPHAIEMRAYREESKITSVIHEENQMVEPNNSPEPEVVKNNAGRPSRREAERRECEKKKRMDEERMGEEFKAAYDSFYEEVRKAKKRNWETTSKKAALNCTKWINDLITL